MKKLLHTALVVMTFLVLWPTQAFGLELTRVGTSTVTDQQFSTWTYTSANPILQGTGVASTELTIAIDSVEYVVMVDSEGHWAYTPTQLDEGSHAITLENEGSSKTFTLVIGSAQLLQTTTTDLGDDELGKGGVGTQSTVVMPEVLPQTGAFSSALVVMGGAASMLAGVGFYLLRRAFLVIPR